MDVVEMEYTEPSDEHEHQVDSTSNAFLKRTMLIDHSKLHTYTTYESSGYVSASSTPGSLPCHTLMTLRVSGGHSGPMTPDMRFSDSQLSSSAECSSSNFNLAHSIGASSDSGIGCESVCSSLKDSFKGDEDDIFIHLSPAAKRPAESLPSPSHVDRINPKVWQSTPVVSDAWKSRPTFADSCDLAHSPPKRRRASYRKSSRDLFSSSIRKKPPTFPQHLIDTPSTSSAEFPSLVGQGSVDFLFYLGKKNILQPALDTILGYLNPADLCRASQVSRSWKTIIENVPQAHHKKKEFVDQCNQIKENLYQSTKKSGQLPFRGQLLAIENFNRTEEIASPSPRSPPVSPSKVRFNLFLKEGQKLESGQTLVQCPQCKLPSRRETDRSAKCTRRGCQYHFCILCLCKFHGDKLCPVSSVRHRKRPTAIGSRESRRNLQRL